MNIPILMYHALSRQKVKNAYAISEEDFIRNMEYLQQHEYQTLLVDEYNQALKKPANRISDRSVVITFDDGHESDFTIALPILKKYNFKATFFITTDWIGTPGFMAPGQLKMLNEAGMSVQSHGKTHKFLNEMGEKEIYLELENSRATLEDILKNKVIFFSFPGGRYNHRAIECARKLKFSALFRPSLFLLRRLRIRT